MSKAIRTILSLAIPLTLVACGGSDTTSSSKPSTPKPVEPGLSYPIETEIGSAKLVANSESVVVYDTDGAQKKVRIESFKGVPYATAARFKHSELVTLEDGYATEFGLVCPQLVLTEKTQGEDCLNLNVWRPSDLEDGDKVPVYVFIHGGDFEQGSGSDANLHADNIVAQGQLDGNPFIAVTFNYRLGLLGSTYTSEETGGNFGIGDQKRALQWVNENIEQFGGDSTRVTLMGQGAGAMSVGILQQQDSEEFVAGSYFQQAIMQSNPYGFEFRGSKSAESLNKVEDLLDLSLTEILDRQAELSKPTSKLVSWVTQSINPLSSDNTPMATMMPFSPYIEYRSKLIGTDIEGYHVKAQPFTTELSVPTVIGFNSNDSRTVGSIADITFLIPMVVELIMDSDPKLISESEPEAIPEMIATWLMDDVHKNQLSEKLLSIEAGDVNAQLELGDIIDLLPDTAYEAVTQLFYGLNNADQNKQLLSYEDFTKKSEKELNGAYSNMKQFNQMTSDMLYSGPTRMKAGENASTQAPVIMYEFSYRSSFNSVVKGNLLNEKETDIIQVIKSLSCSFGTPCNGAELPFVFNKAFRSDGSEFSVSDQDLALMNKLSRAWFSPSLFEREQYEIGTDNVWVIDGATADMPVYDWDLVTQSGIDPVLVNGRLKGLESEGVLAHYLID
ncbi:carboxylesterase family protein [Vibrio methylphosphonaticus]|uniref:carboxylesterase family protein n=1 Tax=Vibrio methylphosphonaticus TaxID=2946866 RepID=UPI00202A7EC5|nr:carboxylesterase family protein [Vibrio methylphosphonaticus]MCL9773918.1 carboxylesterase family protein [Vibrio methylphosphonaticus]